MMENIKSTPIYVLTIIKKCITFLLYYVTLEALITKYVFQGLSIFKYVPEIIIYGLFALWFLTILATGNGIKYLKHDKFLFFLLVYIFVSSIAVNRMEIQVFILSARTFYRYIILYFIIINLNMSEADIVKYLKHLKICGFILVSIGLLQIIIPEFINPIILQGQYQIGNMIRENSVVLNGKAIFSLFERYDRFGAFLCLFILFLLYSGKTRLNTALIIMSTITLIYTYSRQSWFTVIFVFLIGLFYTKKYIKISMIVLCSVLGVLLLSYFKVYEKIEILNIYFGTPIERALQVFNQSFIESNIEHARMRVVLEVLPAFIKGMNLYTFFGLGIGNFGMLANSMTDNMLFYRFFEIFNLPYYGQYHIGDVYWIELLMEIGIIGFILLSLYFVKLFLFLYNKYKKSNNTLNKHLSLVSMGFVISCIVINFFAPNLISTSFSFYFWFVIAISIKSNFINTH
jgi:hypothetical protein